MTNAQLILTVAIIMGATMLTRFLSFLVFPAGRETPAFIRYLGKVLPAAAMAMLVIYCYKGIDLTAGNHGAPELIAGLAVVVLPCIGFSGILAYIIAAIIIPRNPN